MDHWEPSFADRILDIPFEQALPRGLVGIQGALAVPWSHWLSSHRPNHVAPPHASLSEVVAVEAEHKFAIPYRVSSEVAEVFSAMISDEDTYSVAEAKSKHIVSSSGWLEWRREGLSTDFGFHWNVDSNNGDLHGGGIVRHNRRTFFVGKVIVPEGSPWTSAAYFGTSHLPPDDCSLVMGQIARFAICFFAAMATPRVVESHWSSPPPLIQRARRKRGNPYPLLSFNRVAFSPYRTDSSSDEHKAIDAASVRFHDVVGHWRRIVRASGAKDLVWVHPHFRGDPRKGILLKQREL